MLAVRSTARGVREATDVTGATAVCIDVKVVSGVKTVGIAVIVVGSGVKTLGVGVTNATEVESGAATGGVLIRAVWEDTTGCEIATLGEADTGVGVTDCTEGIDVEDAATIVGISTMPVGAAVGEDTGPVIATLEGADTGVGVTDCTAGTSTMPVVEGAATLVILPVVETLGVEETTGTDVAMFVIFPTGPDTEDTGDETLLPVRFVFTIEGVVTEVAVTEDAVAVGIVWAEGRVVTGDVVEETTGTVETPAVDEPAGIRFKGFEDL